jgi:hypothetical protein
MPVADRQVDIAFQEEDAGKLLRQKRSGGEGALLDGIADMQHQPAAQFPMQERALHQRIVHRKPVIGAVERDAGVPHEIAHAHMPVPRLMSGLARRCHCLSFKPWRFIRPQTHLHVPQRTRHCRPCECCLGIT